MVTIVHIAVLFVNTNVAMILNLGAENEKKSSDPYYVRRGKPYSV